MQFLPSINSHKEPPPERMFYYWEAQETEKLKDSSVSIQVKKDHTLPQKSDTKAENSRDLEEEDDP